VVTANDGDGGTDMESAAATVTGPADPLPTISASAKTADDNAYTANTWTNQNVTVHFTCGDDSGVVTCPNDQTVSAAGITPLVSGTATDGTGHTKSASFGPIKIDKVAPGISAAATTADGQAYAAGTWTNQTVTVHYTCSDSGSGVNTCPADDVFSSSGTFTANGTAMDAAGNTKSTQFGQIKIDKGNPTVSFGTTCPTAQVVLGASRSVAWTVTDGGSGVPGPTTASIALDTSTVGSKTVTKSVTDAAGNTASASCTFVVGYQLLGYFDPVNTSKWKAGTTVSVKIALANSRGTQLQACAGCTVTFQAFKGPGGTGQEVGPSPMKYDPTKQQYIFTWKLGPAASGVGAASIRATVTYPDGTTSVLTKDIVITSK